jgi:hypothetical protein
MLPFFIPKDITKVAVNIYIGVLTKLTNQHPLTNRDIKSSLKI